MFIAKKLELSEYFPFLDEKDFDLVDGFVADIEKKLTTGMHILYYFFLNSFSFFERFRAFSIGYQKPSKDGQSNQI